MGKQLVCQLKPGQTVNAPFVVKDKSLQDFAKKPGKYLSLLLGDASGQVQARVWDNADQLAQTFQVGDVIQVEGRMESYQGRMQMIIERLRPLPLDEAPVHELVPHSSRDRGEMVQQLHETIRQVSDRHLRALLELVFGDEELMERFVTVPGAKLLHHAYIGGLLEHTLNVVELCKCAANLHPEINRDLLISAALLHDLGKCLELEGTLTFDYSDVGRFVGHVVLTDRLVNDKLKQLPDFPQHLANLLTHLLLSHHGRREWGAPVHPVIPEAEALHYADNLDARVQGYLAERTAGSDSESNWSRYHNLYEAYIYLGPTGMEEPHSQDQGRLL